MDQELILFTIIGMALVTYTPRMLPIIALTNRSLPDIVITWLNYIPPAILAALLIPSIMLSEGKINLGVSNVFLWVSIPTMAVAVKTRNLYAPVIVGMLLVVIFRLIF